ncbi:hypothetical protein BC826DRAFT_968318 [Russula brevipes]|nr:hypothetical protein BC826DRAFT_968318 [Russula brevipes]
MPASATPHIAPLSDRQLKVRDHGLLASVAFLVVMPLAVIIPRLFRTFTNRWWPVHWLLNSVVSGSLIIASWVKIGHHQHEVVDPHMRIGFIIFGLCLGQVILGTVIHYGSPPAGNVVKYSWWILTVGFWVLYILGLLLLPRQHKQEAKRKLSQLYKEQSSVEMF